MKRNSALTKIIEFAHDQINRQDEPDLIGFDYNGQYIIDPWSDETGRFHLTTDEAFRKYGELNMAQFIAIASEKLGLTDES